MFPMPTVTYPLVSKYIKEMFPSEGTMRTLISSNVGAIGRIYRRRFSSQLLSRPAFSRVLHGCGSGGGLPLAVSAVSGFVPVHGAPWLCFALPPVRTVQLDFQLPLHRE